MTIASGRLPASRVGTAAACAAVVMWGAGNVIVKEIPLSGVAVAFDRLWLGAVVFSALLIARGGRLSWRLLRIALPGGLAFGLDVTLFFTAVKHTSVADASIIGALQPALVFLVAGRLFGERITSAKIGWTVAAIAGCGLAVFASSSAAGRTTSGDLIATGALFAWSWYFVASKQARQELGALEYQAALTIVAAFLVTPIALVHPHQLAIHHVSTAGWIVVMVVVPGGGHLIMNWAHASVPITLTSMLTLGIPVVATAGALVALGEAVTIGQILGMVVVLGALAAVLRSSPRELTSPDTA